MNMQGKAAAMRFDIEIILVVILAAGSCALPDKKVCQGINNKLTLLGTPDDHYRNLVRMYSNCTVVLENLEITYTEDYHDLSFLQTIQEVGGYVLIALNKAANIPLDNLRIIRGHTLYEDMFALAVMSNYEKQVTTKTQNFTKGVRELSLRSLTEILKGGVKVTRNHLLCNVETIQWYDIVDKNSNPAMELILENNSQHCEKCDPGCSNGSCWAPGPENCQTCNYTSLLTSIIADSCFNKPIYDKVAIV